MSWDKITLRQHAGILDALKMESAQKWIKIASIIERKTEEEIGTWDWQTQMIPYIESLKFLENMPTDLKQTFELRGVRYELISLTSKLPAKRFIAAIEHKDSSPYGIAQKLAIVIKPVLDDDFSDEKRQELADEFWEHLTMDIVCPMAAFFLIFYNALLLETQKSLHSELREIAKDLQAEISLPSSADIGHGS